MMPKKIALLTDSCADLSRALIEEYQIHVIPLRIRCRDGEYADGIDITPSDIYARLRAGELPQTSLPAGEDMEAALERVASQGYDGAIAIIVDRMAGGSVNDEGDPENVRELSFDGMAYLHAVSVEGVVSPEELEASAAATRSGE